MSATGLSRTKSPSGIQKRNSVLEDILASFTNNSSKKKQEELKVYDNLQFVDVDKEIHEKKKK